MIFWLADRWGEPDPSKIAALPVDTLYHWFAYFMRIGAIKRPDEEVMDPPEPPPPDAVSNVNDPCAAVMRALM
ncbi:hypothetical protein ERL64_03370 [Hafnia alvei]|nr:hypothetical protein ERL64_03370 [Hafnia alvei]